MSTVTVVVMGVSGSGKTTVAQGLAQHLGWVYAEGDDFHSEANVAKMASGQPLDDDDRRPWLRSIAEWIARQEEAGVNAVVTCSALRRGYRDLLRQGNPSVRFCELEVPEQVIAARLAQRTGHYMPATLLRSQLDALQPLQEDEPGFTVPVQGSPDEVLRHVIAHVERTAPHAG
ncbi:gluconokinase [Kineococcus xinjiangensis]|uniref:Gluconokinase n=1 Tax=Kineococcus xinjiangensis TaxID=512762 RepID=A0A2S6IH16_9ACTN|nr:gluconokinase [Kineococcus xinjiangensis]PPK93476.1 gluconokinase [Kineococcus xinjiangensis]